MVTTRPPLAFSAGRRESEEKDFNEDTNFGKLKRIPHPDLQAFLQKCIAMSVGEEVSPFEDGSRDEGLP